MPRKPPTPCKHPGCARLSHTGYCAQHAVPVFSRPDTRQSSAKRGYDRAWRRIREQVLRQHDIPRSRWHLYDVDHRPRYNPAVEPDHTKYSLVPVLRSEHSRKTASIDGGFGNRLHDEDGEGRVGFLGGAQVDRAGEENISAVSKGPRG